MMKATKTVTVHPAVRDIMDESFLRVLDDRENERRLAVEYVKTLPETARTKASHCSLCMERALAEHKRTEPFRLKSWTALNSVQIILDS